MSALIGQPIDRSGSHVAPLTVLAYDKAAKENRLNEYDKNQIDQQRLVQIAFAAIQNFIPSLRGYCEYELKFVPSKEGLVNKTAILVRISNFENFNNDCKKSFIKNLISMREVDDVLRLIPFVDDPEERINLLIELFKSCREFELVYQSTYLKDRSYEVLDRVCKIAISIGRYDIVAGLLGYFINARNGRDGDYRIQHDYEKCIEIAINIANSVAEQEINDRILINILLDDMNLKDWGLTKFSKEISSYCLRSRAINTILTHLDEEGDLAESLGRFQIVVQALTYFKLWYRRRNSIINSLIEEDIQCSIYSFNLLSKKLDLDLIKARLKYMETGNTESLKRILTIINLIFRKQVYHKKPLIDFYPSFATKLIAINNEIEVLLRKEPKLPSKSPNFRLPSIRYFRVINREISDESSDDESFVEFDESRRLLNGMRLETLEGGVRSIPGLTNYLERLNFFDIHNFHS